MKELECHSRSFVPDFKDYFSHAFSVTSTPDSLHLISKQQGCDATLLTIVCILVHLLFTVCGERALFDLMLPETPSTIWVNHVCFINVSNIFDNILFRMTMIACCCWLIPNGVLLKEK